MRVQFPDGSTAEFTQQHLDRFTHGWHRTGDIVPVRYDEHDHSKIAVDTDALASEREGEAAQVATDKQMRIARAEAELAGHPAPHES